jgi:hypothetical protein
MDTDKTKKLLIGYWPLLQPEGLISKPGETLNLENLESLKDLETEVPPINAILWVYPFDKSLDGPVIPVFVMDRAKEIADHLITWMDGDTDRFTLHFEQRKEGYACILLPSVKKTIERWKLARLMYHEDMVINEDFVVYYHVLGTCCLSGSTYIEVKDRISDPCFVGFLDRSELDVSDPLTYNSDKVTITGPFKIGENKSSLQAKAHFNNLFDEAKPIKFRDGDDDAVSI